MKAHETLKEKSHTHSVTVCCLPAADTGQFRAALGVYQSRPYCKVWSLLLLSSAPLFNVSQWQISTFLKKKNKYIDTMILYIMKKCLDLFVLWITKIKTEKQLNCLKMQPLFVLWRTVVSQLFHLSLPLQTKSQNNSLWPGLTISMLTSG